MAKVSLLLILSPNWMTKLMQAADLFEQHKVVGLVQRMDVCYKENELVDYDRAKRLMDNLIEEYKKDTKTHLVFMHLVAIESNDTILLNRTLRVPYYRDETTKVVSTGENWILLDEIIKSLIET